jgi:hypothetical protein
MDGYARFLFPPSFLLGFITYSFNPPVDKLGMGICRRLGGSHDLHR